MKIGEQVKVRLGGETLWAEVVSLPDDRKMWRGKLLNTPLFHTSKWGDVLTFELEEWPHPEAGP